MTGAPSSWPVVSLGEICTLNYGKALPESARTGGETAVYGSNGVVGYHNSSITSGRTIIIGRKGSFGEVNYSDTPCWPIDTAYFVDETSTKADIRWLSYRLAALGLNKLNKAAAVPGLNRDDAYRQQLLLPPLPEQRRIAAILDQADALRAKRREALAQLDELQKAIFIEMFGDGKKYPEKSLDELCSLITDGTHQTPTYADEGITFLSAKNVTSGKIDWSNVKFIPNWLHVELHKRLAPRRNDILLAKNGTTGVAAIVDRDDIFDVYVSLALLRPKLEVLPSYLHAAINSSICKKQFNGALKGIGVPNLHLKEIRATKVPSPPFEAQMEFESRIAALESLRKDNISAMVELEALFSSLQHRAFQGEL